LEKKAGGLGRGLGLEGSVTQKILKTQKENYTSFYGPKGKKETKKLPYQKWGGGEPGRRVALQDGRGGRRGAGLETLTKDLPYEENKIKSFQRTQTEAKVESKYWGRGGSRIKQQKRV